MASGNLQMTVEIDTALLELQLRCLQGAMTAPEQWMRDIEFNALAALAEIKDLADAARKAISAGRSPWSAMVYRIDVRVERVPAQGRIELSDKLLASIKEAMTTGRRILH